MNKTIKIIILIINFLKKKKLGKNLREPCDLKI